MGNTSHAPGRAVAIQQERKFDRKIEVYLPNARRAPSPHGNPPHKDLANLSDGDAAVKAFANTWGLLIPDIEQTVDAPRQLAIQFEGSITEARDLLRRAWRGDSEALTKMETVLEVPVGSLFFTSDGKLFAPGCGFWQLTRILFLRDFAAGDTAICGNPNCPQPYFIKGRKTNKFCGATDCTVFNLRKHRRNWWNETGKKQREEKREKAQRKRRKAS